MGLKKIIVSLKCKLSGLLCCKSKCLNQEIIIEPYCPKCDCDKCLYPPRPPYHIVKQN
jgi:hypothetical protein